MIRRPHLKRAPDVIEGTLDSIRTLGYWVKPIAQVRECIDPDDNIFLECANAAEADYVVTRNQRHFPDRWKKTRMISARELVELLVGWRESQKVSSVRLVIIMTDARMRRSGVEHFPCAANGRAR